MSRWREDSRRRPEDRSGQPPASAALASSSGRSDGAIVSALKVLDPRTAGFAAALSVGGIAIAFLLGILLGPERHEEGFAPAVAISAVLVATRHLALRYALGRWIIAVDALACLVAVVLTSAPHSEFHFVALAGIWWAGRLAARHGAAVFALAFLAPYIVIVLPAAWDQGTLAEATEDLLTVAVLALLVDWYMAIDRRAVRLSDALSAWEARAGSPLELRRRLALAAGESDVPVDSIMAASELGLTADQVELLGYLLLGFGNVRIADAIGRSEATVRYRLTALYRVLGVRGRRAAAQRARELGLDSLVSVEELRRRDEQRG